MHDEGEDSWRGVGYAFYFQFLILLTMIVVASWTALKAVRSGKAVT